MMIDVVCMYDDDDEYDYDDDDDDGVYVCMMVFV